MREKEDLHEAPKRTKMPFSNFSFQLHWTCSKLNIFFLNLHVRCQISKKIHAIFRIYFLNSTVAFQLQKKALRVQKEIVEMCFRRSNVLITFYFKKKYSNNYFFMLSWKKTLLIRTKKYPILSQRIHGNCKNTFYLVCNFSLLSFSCWP